MTVAARNDTEPGQPDPMGDAGKRTTRRGLLGALAAGLAVFSAKSIGRMSEAGASNGNPVLLGSDNTEASTATIRNSGQVGTLGPALGVYGSNASSGNGGR